MNLYSDFEEDFHSKDRKQGRKDRKLAQSGDRSKFKKTDLTAKVAEILDPHLKRGRVIAITGEGSWVDCEGATYLCSLRGQLKKEVMRIKNLLAVGDFVRFDPAGEGEGTIIQIEERYSVLARTDITGRKEQLIATNIDQVIIIASFLNPPLKPALIDRYLIAAEKGNLHPILIINKVDLLSEASQEEQERFREFLSVYELLGFPILSLSTKTGAGIEALHSLLVGKTSVFSGQSGVGKSSLLNSCFGLQLKTGPMDQKTAKGTHTTTTARLIPLPGGGYCVDTPGIRSFGVWSLQKEEVLSHFTDIAAFATDCRYKDCAHRKEPNCAVQKALEEGNLSQLRYESYSSLLDEATGGIDNRTKRKQEPET